MKKEITKKTVAGIAKEIKALLEGNRGMAIYTYNGEPGISFEKEGIYTGRPGGTFSFSSSSFTPAGSLTAVSRRKVEGLLVQIKRGYEVEVKVYE